ncbi:head-tail adaptor Ad1 [Mycobacterium phage Zaka]|uniref:Head-to-tail adaptor n=8 Tax=Caudoviricetes TaxID=2731619 RepID=V5R4E9_9CAUD|nr:head-tail adaptor Ad1 [Mycobacterium phage Zaka]YP_009224143.1 head-tail adaptor Ad1 [Mycobacterium phage VohminGhazi]YP_009637825.1 head-tail adaptor Ad1 [Mycobacterium phage EricB]YP_010061154.1 head-tail adaptor Ad1 [Mycobacterium phage JewelBug]YP_010061245.1 head-tail adaptor Ad1 [Mycobacterium phage Priamo]AEK08464.1 head-to-tail adaptor [Mycobacterium phage DaVinci]AMQ66855.1 head-to-tail adaptor [Mycobacterium phage McFly]AMW64369.1 head-to-tail adaptor [Mycobacterium phage Kazan]
MAYASADDVVTLWAKEPEPEVMALIDRRLEQVERMIRRRIPNLDLKVDASATFQADLIDIESDAVLRLVRNPEGYLSETDGVYSYQLQADLSQGKLTILDDEWEILGVNSLKRMAVIVPNIVLPT